ncbi:MAG: glutaredoxin family protein [Acidiferrobacterales bacterium]
MAGVVLTLYGRTHCHLCEEMQVALEPWRSRLGFVVKSVDIDDDPILCARFGDKVPVLMQNDREICRYIFDEQALLTCLGECPTKSPSSR